MESRLRIIVTGLIAQYPLGGVTWDYLQYVLGLHALGHEVYYLEDTGQWPYNPLEGGVSEHCAFNVRYLSQVMARFGLSGRWGYRFPWKAQWFGLSKGRWEQICRNTDLLINVSGALADPGRYREAACLAYIDSDPVFTQVKLARGQPEFSRLVDMHDVHFSFGESLVTSPVPATGHEWLPTRQPVVLGQWHPYTAHREVFTTVMNWTSYKPLTYKGLTFGQKDTEFERFMDLPSQIPDVRLEVAVNEGKTRRPPRALLRRHGWQVVDPNAVCADLQGYRNYIESSMAEWSVAKNGYVVGRPGWFSCRSACYLAAGRPVVVQDTGFSGILPVGEGLLTFRTTEEAIAGITDVRSHYARHARAARGIAEDCFASDTVLTSLIERSLEAVC